LITGFGVSIDDFKLALDVARKFNLADVSTNEQFTEPNNKLRNQARHIRKPLSAMFMGASTENKSPRRVVPHHGPGDPWIGGDFDERGAVCGVRGQHVHQQMPQPLVRCTIQSLLHNRSAKMSFPKFIVPLSTQNTNKGLMPSVIMPHSAFDERQR
jgi:hypothetical protein